MDRNNIVKIILISIAFIVLIFFAAVYTDAHRELPAYNSKNDIYIEETTKKTTIDSYTINNPDLNFSLEIPENWVKVNRDGYDSYIHAPSASAVNISVSDYDGTINEFLQQSCVSSMIAENSAELINYSSQGNSNVKYSYRILTDAGIQNVSVLYTWDLNHVIMVEVMIKEENISKFPGTTDYILSSFKWEKQNPIPEEYYYFYSMFGDMTFAMPSGWDIKYEGNEIVAIDSATNAKLYVGIASGENIDYTKITQLEYGRLTGNNVSNFVLTAFENQGNHLRGEATYRQNNTRMFMLQELFTDGNYQCTITLEVPYADMSKVAELVKKCTAAFAFN